MKWTTLTAAVVALGLNSVANAGMYTPPCKPQNVTIPCERTGWHLLAEGLYLEPSNDDIEYAEVITTDPRTRHAMKLNHRFGFRIEAGYQFDAGNDLTANWTHFDRKFNDFLDASSLPQQFSDTVDVHSRVDIELVQLELGQHFDVGNNGDLRIHFDAQYLKLDTFLMIERISAQGTLPPTVAHNKYISDFNGIGPRAGADWMYHLPNGFDFVARAAGSVLVGERKSEWRRSVLLPIGSAWQPFVDRHTRRTIIPTLEGRCGLRWTHLADAMAVSVEAGYHAMGIFQAVHFLGGNPNVDAPLRPEQNVSNYGHQGPYANIVINV